MVKENTFYFNALSLGVRTEIVEEVQVQSDFFSTL
jgi:hypothetical protein